jgi:hypothetical protein
MISVSNNRGGRVQLCDPPPVTKIRVPHLVAEICTFGEKSKRKCKKFSPAGARQGTSSLRDLNPGPGTLLADILYASAPPRHPPPPVESGAISTGEDFCKSNVYIGGVKGRVDREQGAERGEESLADRNRNEGPKQNNNKDLSVNVCTAYTIRKPPPVRPILVSRHEGSHPSRLMAMDAYSRRVPAVMRSEVPDVAVWHGSHIHSAGQSYACIDYIIV